MFVIAQAPSGTTVTSPPSTVMVSEVPLLYMTHRIRMLAATTLTMVTVSASGLTHALTYSLCRLNRDYLVRLVSRCC